MGIVARFYIIAVWIGLVLLALQTILAAIIGVYRWLRK